MKLNVLNIFDCNYSYSKPGSHSLLETFKTLWAEMGDSLRVQYIGQIQKNEKDTNSCLLDSNYIQKCIDIFKQETPLSRQNKSNIS